MITYIIAHIDVLILRRRMQKAPRTFKVPLSPVLPVAGIIGTCWMIYNIASDPAVRIQIYVVTGIIFAILAVYSVIWIKKVLKAKLFEPFPVKDVMAMENELYPVFHQEKYKIKKISNQAAAINKNI